MVIERPAEQVNMALIDGEPYRIIRQENGQMYQQDFVNEPPWTGQEPPIGSDPSFTWHLGALKSRQGIPGTSEYGNNTDARWALSLWPSGQVQTWSIAGNPNDVTYMFSGLGYLWVLAGSRVYRIDVNTDTVVASKTNFTGSALSGAEWEGKILVSLDDNNVWQMTTIVPGGPDTWTEGAGTTVARYLAKGFNRLFKAHNPSVGTVTMKNLSLGVDPLAETNWADEVTAPGQVEDLIAYERTIIMHAGEANGLYSIGEEGFGVPLARRLKPSGRMRFVEPFIYIPHRDGTARFVPGTVQSVGIENEILNESPVNGEVIALAADGAWIYMVVYSTSPSVKSYILAGRERRGTEAGFGPIIWDTFLTINNQVPYIEIAQGDGFSELCLAVGTNVQHVHIPWTGGAPPVTRLDYPLQQSGDRYSVKYNFDDRGEKDFPYVDVKGEGVDSNNYWELSYSIDGGGFVNTDREGALMRLNTSALTRFNFNTAAHGVQIQYRLNYVLASPDNKARITYFEPFFKPRPRRIQQIMLNLSLETGAWFPDRRSLLDMYTLRDRLEALVRGSSAVPCRGPWSTDTDQMFVTSFRILQGAHNDALDQRILCEVVLQERSRD